VRAPQLCLPTTPTRSSIHHHTTQPRYTPQRLQYRRHPTPPQTPSPTHSQPSPDPPPLPPPHTTPTTPPSPDPSPFHPAHTTSTTLAWPHPHPPPTYPSRPSHAQPVSRPIALSHRHTE